MVFGSFLVGVLSGCGQKQAPNVLLFTLDTTRIDAIGAYVPGAPSATPEIDRLTASGVRFDRAYTVTPLTIPAHSSLHTGLLPPRHQVRDNGDAFLSEHAVTLAERLQAAGYQTMASVGAEVTSHHWGFQQGFDAYFDRMETKDNRWRIERRGEEVVADAMDWLGQASPDKPWFAWVHLFDAHTPYDPPEPYRSKYPRDPYRGEVAYVDAQVGKVLASLSPEVRARTYVFVMADHGESLGEHGEAAHGVLLYDATTRIPFIVAGPDIKPTTVGTPVSLVDVLPTVLSLAGVKGGDGDGFDLSPLLQQHDRSVSAPAYADREVYVESLYALAHYGWAPQRAWVSAGHKLIDSTTPELYVRGDVRELNDRARAEPDQVRAMVADLNAYAATLVAQAEVASLDWDAERQAQLEALGYVTAGPVGVTTGPLPDPRDKLPILADVERARLALQSGDLETSKRLLETIVEREPTLLDPRMLLASILERSGDSAGAAVVLDGILAIQRSSRVLTFAGAVRMRRSEFDLARPLLEESKDLDPYVAQTWHGLLTVLWAQGDRAGFDVALREALTRLPTDIRIRGFEALSDAMRGGNDGIAALTLALGAGPLPFFQHAIGVVEARQGHPDAAEQAFLEEIRMFPPSVASRRALVAMLADQGRYEEQLEHLRAVAAREEPSADTFHSMAQALFNLGRYPEAKALVLECRAFAPRYPGCAMLEANVHAKLGDPVRAKVAYEEALALVGQQGQAGQQGQPVDQPSEK